MKNDKRHIPESTTNKSLCYYHAKFGEAARKCNRKDCPLSHLVQTTDGKKVSMVGHRDKNTMTVWDRRSGRTYLVDCGADFSVFPASLSDKRSLPPSKSLVAANGSIIRTWGKRNIPLLLGNGRSFTQEFYIAEVTEPILGSLLTMTLPLTWPGAASSTLQLSHLRLPVKRHLSLAFMHPQQMTSIASLKTFQSFSFPASSPQTLTSMGWNTTSLQKAPQSMHVPDA